MKISVHIYILAMVFFAVGCATSYQSAGFTGGFSDTQLAPDMFRVNFRGNGHTSDERAQDFAMLRAADLSLQHGFNCFAILDENNTTTTQSFSTPGSAYTIGSAYSYGNSTTYSGYTTYSPGQTYIIHKPRSGLTIKCFQMKPKDILTFDAAFLENSIKEKYHMPLP